MKKITKKISIVASIITGCIVFIHIINKFIFLLCTIKEMLFREIGSFYTWRFGKIFYTKKGSGSPILLIHDLTAASSHYEWKAVSEELAKTHTVYCIDLLGFGRSDKPKMTYTNYLYVQLISDFIKNVIKEKTDIVTSGKSCAVSIMSCYIDSYIYNNLILINPTDFKIMNQYPHKKHKVLKWFLDIPIFGTLLYNINHNRHRLQNKFQNDYFYKKNIHKKDILAFSEAAHLGGSSSKYVYASIKCHYTNTNIIHALKGINNSIHIIGSLEISNMEQIVKEYASLNPSIEAMFIRNTKALPHMENSKECCNLIRLFLNE